MVLYVMIYYGMMIWSVMIKATEEICFMFIIIQVCKEIVCFLGSFPPPPPLINTPSSSNNKN